MSRLFIAIDLPDPVKSALQQCQPLPQPGIRITRQEQRHLTLHFLGESSVAAVAAALQSLRFVPFDLTIEGTGSFANQERGSILWAGVRHNPELLKLQQAIATVLARTGFRAEARPYAPHITLARCEPRVPAEVIRKFLEDNADLSLPPLQVNHLKLYSSVLTPAGPNYELQQVIPAHDSVP